MNSRVPKHNALWIVLAALAGTASGVANATEPLRFYLGASVGQSAVRVDQIPLMVGISPFGGSLSFSKSDVAWKLIGGFRPISLVGAELEYVDFGRPTASHIPVPTGIGYTADMRAKATVAFGVLYAPMPIPFLDMFGKAGLAHLHTTADGTEYLVPELGCPSPLCQSFAPFHRDRTDTRFAYGGGAQVKFSSLAIRGEYERISASTGDPSLLSLGLTWQF